MIYIRKKNLLFPFLPRRRFRRTLFFCFLFFSLATGTAEGAEKVKDDLEEAIKDGEKDILFSGKESDDVKIKKNVQVIGESRSKATINGDVIMEDGAVLKNVTVNARLFGITVEKNATVVIENVSIKGAADTGIYSKQGGGTLTVRNSSISKNRKGFYILPGKRVAITGNQVTENAEEGIDIRKDVDGVISGNTVAQNREGGTEVLVGDSTLTITRNIFSQNKSSGLALQFYPENNYGKMTVSLNTFSGNGDYGVICNSPSGGDKPDDFFKKSVALLENTFGANKKGVMKGCGLINIVPEEEKAEEVAEVPPPVPQIPFEEEPSRIKEVRLEKLAGDAAGIEGEIKEPREYLRNLRHYVFGSDEWYFDTQRENLRRLQEQLDQAEALPESPALTAMNNLFPGKVARLRSQLKALNEILDSQEHWSPFTW